MPPMVWMFVEDKTMGGLVGKKPWAGNRTAERHHAPNATDTLLAKQFIILFSSELFSRRKH